MIINVCPVCKKPFFLKNICPDCLSLFKEDVYLHISSSKVGSSAYPLYYFSSYSGLMKVLISAYKEKVNHSFAKVFAELFNDSVVSNKEHFKNSLFIPLPSSRKGERYRGFNQVVEILRFAKANYANILRINPHHKAEQKKLNRQQRANNSVNKYSIFKNIYLIEYLNNIENIVLFDDIHTTGSSLASASKVIENFLSQNNLNIKISWLILAKVGKKE